MTGVDITSVPMTRAEEIRLTALEQAVDAAISSFVHGGKALEAIRCGQLFRATHSSFEAYVDERFGYARSYAYRLIEAAKIAEIVSPIGNVANEAQARELVGLPPDEAREVYRRAIESSDGKPTATTIREARWNVVQQPAQPRRKPLPDAVRKAVYDLGKRAESLERLTRDDRWASNRSSDGMPSRHELQRTIEALQRVHAAMDPAGGTEPIEFDDSTIVENKVLSNVLIATSKVGWKPTVVIEVGSNTATVLDGGVQHSVVRAAIDRLGIKTQPDKTAAQLVTFSARYADDLQAALELRGICVELRPVTP